MKKEMLINVSEGEECRIALLEDGKLEELYIERTSSTSHVGNIYKGRVTNVEPSIQAAFVDFGLGRNGFLHISDLMPSYFGRGVNDVAEPVGRKIARRDRPPIQRCLRRGEEITVQIIKEGIGTKGPTLTTYLSVPGRILVMMPGMTKYGVSRKIEDDEERRRLRQILDSLKPTEECGFIIRTAGVGKTKTEIERDLKYLTRLWENIKKKLKQPAPVELYTEGDLVNRTVRDVYSSDVQRIVVDNKDVARTIKEFFTIAMPRTRNKVELYEDLIPLFHKHGIEQEIERMYSRHVPLPSGGSLVIDSTEAIVAIDVNSGRFREHADAETTAFRTDMEAADEIPRQLRLRDLGGVIICDFIDLRFDRHRRELERKLHENLKKDRAKTKVLRMSQFGIIEMTRQRMRPSLKRSIYSDCPHCKGSGLVKTPESMSLDVMRRLAIAVHDQRVVRAELSVCPEVAFYLLNRKRSQLVEVEGSAKKKIIVRQDNQLGLDEMRLQLFDHREGLVILETLGIGAHEPQPSAQAQQERRRDRRPQRRGGKAQPQPPQEQHPPEPSEEEHLEMESVEEAVEQREHMQRHESATSVAVPAPALASAPTEASEKNLPRPGTSTPTGDEPLKAAARVQPQAHQGEAPARRRRRGRRGRGRGRRAEAQVGAAKPPKATPPLDEPLEPAESEPLDAALADEAAPSTTAKPAEPPPSATNGQEQPRRRRRRRGGRRHRRRKDTARELAGSQETGLPDGPAGPDTSRPAPSRVAPPRAGAPDQPAVRTGSTDKHLIQDDPVQPEPPRRPRSYRDLDAIPDDLD